MSKKVAVIMGSDSDLPVVKGALDELDKFGIPYEVHVMSAHRTPALAAEFAGNAKKNGFGVILSAAGKAAHLGGVLAAHTTLPVIGIPVKSSTLDGLDALLATVQMPKGIPVATVAIDGAANAAILAAQMLALSDPEIDAKLEQMKADMEQGVKAKDAKISAEYSNCRFHNDINLIFLEEQKMADWKKTEQLYEGKAKKVFATENPEVVIVDYKDDATAFNGEKKGTIVGKGVINNRMSNYIMKQLEKEGVPTHLVEELSDRETAVKKVSIVPLEVIVRNVAAGSFSKRMGVEEGKDLLCPILEFSYKCDELNDPFINDDYALALGLATQEEIDTIKNYTRKVNEVLKKFFLSIGIRLIDFKIEFGRLSDGTIILADEISPDTCRLWDVKTNEKLDKDRFRRDMGGTEEAYQEVMKRIFGE